MADRHSAVPNPVLRQVRVDELQMSRMEFAATVRAAGEEMGEPVGCRSRLVAAWEDGEVGCPRGVYRRILTQMTRRSMAALGFRTGPAALMPNRLQVNQWPGSTPRSLLLMRARLAQ
ncbi:hypothetical protein ACXZ65_28040 [Streptomyces aculeolatus]